MATQTQAEKLALYHNMIGKSTINGKCPHCRTVGIVHYRSADAKPGLCLPCLHSMYGHYSLYSMFIEHAKKDHDCTRHFGMEIEISIIWALITGRGEQIAICELGPIYRAGYNPETDVWWRGAVAQTYQIETQTGTSFLSLPFVEGPCPVEFSHQYDYDDYAD